MTITPDMTAGALHDALSLAGAGLVVRAMAALERGSLAFTPQPAVGVTYAAKIDKAETRIDFAKPAAEVHNHIRGLSPFPGAWFELDVAGKRERVKVLATTRSGAPQASSASPGTVRDADLWVICGDGQAVRLLTLQRAGKTAMDAAAFARGLPGIVGAQLL
jgi:methionyl-tRNA formyltransferase